MELLTKKFVGGRAAGGDPHDILALLLNLAARHKAEVSHFVG
jgi:hypothetical protein